MSNNEFPGLYFDGHSAGRQPVMVIPVRHGLSIQRESGDRLWWPYENVNVRRDGGTIEFTTRSQLPESLVMSDPGFLAALARMSPRVARGGSPSANGDMALKLAALVAACVLLAVLLLWKGFPALTGLMAAALPASVEEKIGKAALGALAPESKRCTDKSVEELVRTLERTVPRKQFPFRIYVAEDEMVNAFAAPGGYMVIFRGLLDKTRKPELAAAVLAHEMQHVVQRHAAKSMMRGISIWVALMLMTGDPTATIAGIAANLGSLAYMREDEASADREGLKMLAAAGIDPLAMVDMLEMLNKEEGDLPRAAQYFSSHPLTRDRIEDVRKFAEPLDYRRSRLMPNAVWPPEKSQCKASSARD